MEKEEIKKRLREDYQEASKMVFQMIDEGAYSFTEEGHLIVGFGKKTYTFNLL